MPGISVKVMDMLYKRNIWEEFSYSKDNVQHQGWNGVHHALRRLAFTAREPIVLDVGVWKGESTITIASAMRDARINGCVIAIDTFLGSVEHWHHHGVMFTRSAGLPNLYRTFLSNICSLGLQSYVVPLPQTSSAAVQILTALSLEVSGVHIDASHDYQDVLRDAIDYRNILSVGGVLIGDDYDPSWPGVVRAVHDFSSKTGCQITVDRPKWLAQKVRATSIA